MADAEALLDAREVSEMSPEEQGTGKKWIKGSDNLDWGMKNRLARLVQRDGHCQFLPIDHGYFQGPTRCLERPQDTIRDILPYADGLFVTRGVLRASIAPDIKTPIILRVSGGTSVVGKDLADVRNNPNYILPITRDNAEKIRALPGVVSVEPVKRYTKGQYDREIFPHDERYPWNLEYFGPLTIPKKGETVEINLETLPLYRRIIETY